MAGLPLNTFKNVPRRITTTMTAVYTAPLGVTSIVLMAQVSNVSSVEARVSFVHKQHKNPGLETFIVKDIIVPPNDARILLGGKLVMESLDQIMIQGSAPDVLQFIASILESANQ